MNTADIVALKDELVERDAPRHAKYDVIMAAIGGGYDSRRLEGFWQTYSQLTGRTLPSDREWTEFRINLIPSIIESKRAFISTIPQISCPPAKLPPPGDTKLRETAEKLERVYLGFWQYSNIGKRMNQLGYWNPALGSTVGVVWPDTENKRPTMQMRSPYGCYPVLADVDGQSLKQVVFVTKYKRRHAAAMYPELASKVLAGEGDVTVCQYIDDERITVIVDDQHRAKDIENKWGFVPCLIIPNQSFGEGPWGDSDVEQVIPVQEEFIFRESLKTAILEQTIMQPLAIEGGDNLPAEIPMGPRDAIPVQLGGKVYRVPPVQVPYQYLQSQSDLVKFIDRVGNTPPVMQGQFDGSVLTGKGVSTLMGPAQMAFNVKGNEIYPAMATLNKMAMRMWHAMWPRATHTVFHMARGNRMVVETFKTGEFEGFYENVVYVDSSNYFDSQSRFVMVLQAVQNRLMSRRTARMFVPGVTDSAYEEELIKSEFDEDMKLQQAAQAFDAANVQPDVASQGALNANLSKGYAAKTPVPEMIGGFEVPEPGQEQEQPQSGALLEDMVEFFQNIPLRGRVWLAGGIVTDPNYGPNSSNYAGIEVFLEQPSDKSAINTTMRNQFPDVWGHLMYHEGAPSPEEPSILVYDPQGGEEEFEMEPEGQPLTGGSPPPLAEAAAPPSGAPALPGGEL